MTIRWPDVFVCIATASILAVPKSFAETGGGSIPAVEPGCPKSAIQVPAGSFIQRLVEGAPAGSKFCIGSGVHRLQAIFPKERQEFHGQPGAILNGARILDEFRRENDLYVAEGLRSSGIVRGDCMESRPSCGHPEALFIDGIPLEQVPDLHLVRPGTFHFDYGAGRIYLAEDPAGRTVEASTIPFAFIGTAPGVIISGLTIEKYATPAQEGAVQGEYAAGWHVENSEIRLNSGVGVSVGSNGRISGNFIHHNGQLGITAGGNDILVEGNEIAHNNIYGFNPAWEAGGLKITGSSGVVIRHNHVHNNEGAGLWTDIDVRDVLFESNVVEYNRDAGIFHEISYDAVIRHNNLRYNNQGSNTWFWGAEILIAASEGVEVYGNQIKVGDESHGIVLVDQNRLHHDGREYYRTRNNRIYGNTLTFDGDGMAGGVSDADPGDVNYLIIQNGNNRFDRNEYRVPRNSSSQRFGWGHQSYDFSGFQGQGQEPNGRMVRY